MQIDPLNVVVPERAKRWRNVRPVIDAGPKYEAKLFNKKFVRGELFHRVTADTVHYAVQRSDNKCAPFFPTSSFAGGFDGGRCAVQVSLARCAREG